MARRKGIPSIRQRKDRNGKKLDVWEALITLGRDPGTGKVKRLPVYGKTQQECRDKLIETLQSIKTQTFVEPHKITVESWLDTWLKEYKKDNIRPTTYSSYEYIIRVHIKPNLGKAYLKEIKPEQIQKFYNERKASGLSSRTVRYIHTVLHEALRQAVRNNLIVRNVSEATTLPKQEKKEMRVLTVKEQNEFMKVLSSDKKGIIFKLDLATGLRKGELLALRWADVDLKNGVIMVKQALSRTKVNFDKDSKENKTAIIIQKPKTKKGERSVPLFSSIASDLKAHKTAEKDKFKDLGWDDIKIKQHFKDGLVFTNELGGHIEPRNLSRKFYSLVKASGIPKANLHALRHSLATRLLEAGVSPKVVQEILGHSTITLTLDTYSHVMPELKKDAIDKLSGLFDSKPTEKQQKENSAT
jgi:integrase